MIHRKGVFLRSSLSALDLTWSPQCQASAQKAHEQTPHGYIVRDPTPGRNKKEASVQRIAAIATDEAPNLDKRKKAGGRSVSYQIDKISEGGSGGSEYQLRVLWVNEGGAFIYSQRDQSEYGEPSFELCWDLVKTTELFHRK